MELLQSLIYGTYFSETSGARHIEICETGDMRGNVEADGTSYPPGATVAAAFYLPQFGHSAILGLHLLRITQQRRFLNLKQTNNEYQERPNIHHLRTRLRHDAAVSSS